VHIPDGFIDAPTSAAAAVVAVGVIGACARRSTASLDDRLVPLTGLVAAFVFAAQTVNFPVASGTSGHLLGGVLAAVLIGPSAGVLCITTVLVVQTLLFADGGLTALGLNVVNMAIVPALAGYALFALTRRAARSDAGLALAAGVTAAVTVVLSSLVFCLEFAVGGDGVAPVGSVVAAMVGVHVVIGIGEGVITASVLAAVLATRPDLVHGRRPEHQAAAVAS
jgi:cobalt/nickel transport system permease protein